MLLRSLSVYGFKSFAEKTQLEFGRGVTAIVGPNGSGKSNISDAIRWILGEQSAKTLRGSKMEDVIFAGASGRKPLGVAEASLIFDNSDGKLALEYSEVIITRRMFRSGESEYFINKAHCRLKDIYELLADTGLGRDSMTVIGQNKVDEILSGKPDERRLLFEDAAGIAKYKQRKKDALKKLETTEQNLVRLSDISAEIENQLQPLAESAAKTLRFNELSAKLKAAQATILLDRLEKAEKMVHSAQLEKESLTDGAVLLATKLSLSETEKEKLTTATYNLEEQLTQLDQNIRETDTELERLAGKNALLAERIAQGQSSRERIKEELERVQQEKSRVVAELTRLRQTLTARRGQAGAAGETLTAKNEAYGLLCRTIQEAEEKIQLGKEQTFDHLKQMVDERNNLKTLQRDLTNLQIQRKNLANEYTAYLEQSEKNTLALKEYERNQREVLEQTAANEEKMRRIAVQRDKLQQDLAACRKEEGEVVKKINAASSHLKILTSMQKDFEGFGRAIRAVLKSGLHWRDGVCGAVAQLITAKDEYITAVEIALGGSLQHIVCEGDHTAKAAIAFLKENRLGRATFLPLNTIKGTSPREAEKAAATNAGAMGFLADFVVFEEKYRKIVEFLLGRTILAVNIDAALKIAREASFAVRIVTVEGELLNPGGSLTGGSSSDKSDRDASFLARENKIKNMKSDLDVCQEDLIAKEKETAQIDAALETVNRQSDALHQENRELELKKAELAVYLEKALTEENRLALALKTVANEITAAGREEDELTAKITVSQNNLLAFENRDSAQKTQINELEEKLKIFKDKQEALSVEITELKIELASLTQQIEAVSANCQGFEQNEIAAQRQYDRLVGEDAGNLAKIEEAKSQITQLSMTRAAMAKSKKELEEKRRDGYEKKLGLLANAQKIEKEHRELRRKEAEIQKRLHEADLLFTKYEAVAAHVLEEITVTFGLSLAEAGSIRARGKIEDLTAAVTGLEREIAALGPVNPAAVEEYEKVSARYNFLKEQRDDLVAAKDYLASIILEIDQTMSKQFLNAFRAINKHFADAFIKLFGGGTAKLELVDPDNLLETGIEIIVEPPGKKLQNLALLSGGERALTVIALLFAFLAYRPAPFCVVDEIDASLDEANLKRFGEFLKGYSDTTQFIVVTHRKGTMEAADVLHGVTMEEAGISRLVSVKLMDKAG